MIDCKYKHLFIYSRTCCILNGRTRCFLDEIQSLVIKTILFFNRVVGTWNSLPLSIREATSVNSFKALVRKFFMG